MDILKQIWDIDTSLDSFQMGIRGVTVFISALILIRISGRRSFGIGSPLDNIIVILLGAILSRAVVGASPFIPVIVTCLAIVLLHRFVSWLKSKNSSFNKLVDGEKIMVFNDGKFLHAGMSRAQICKEDIMQGIRKSALTDDLNVIRSVYIEYTGEITVVKKDTQA
ncbi:YetF domain-containing protein [Chryseobacterium sp. NRRL B-14798]|uniref:DUF421 domain-containing protein n=1 Tax=Chryseobacterium sp. NRRL B-14798 TaxID=3162880 RepID=UPI003D235CE7